MSSIAVAPAPAAGPVPRTLQMIVHVAWMSLALGIGLEVILLLIAAGYGTFTTIQPFVADLVQKITWASVVCVGLALGGAAAKMRPQVTGLCGLLFAPAGFSAARALHKGTEKALGIVSATPAGPSPLMLAGVKSLEYALLGVFVGWLGRKQLGIWANITAGFGVAVLFGGFILGSMDWYSPKGLAGAALLTRVVNELLFPVGCSVVLYAAEALTRKVVAR